MNNRVSLQAPAAADRFGVDEWGDPTFDAVTARQEQLTEEERAELWAWNLAHRQRHDRIDTTDFTQMPKGGNGLTYNMSPRHRKRVARSAGALNNPGGRRTARKSKAAA